jgi:hypothetical protein
MSIGAASKDQIMTEPVPPDLLRAVWEYPLFDAFYGRRSRRFGLPDALPICRRPHLPQHITRPPYGAVLTNDHWVYVIDPSAGSAGKMREARTPAERDQALDLYRRHRQTLQNRRFEIPRRAPPLCGHNLWDSNMPGSTLFMPVCDVSFSLIGLIAQFVDARLERFATTAGRGMHIVDDRFDFRPAGTDQWVRSGFLDRDNVLPLSHLERQVCYFMFSEPAVICQNMFLATEAMGIGGWMPLRDLVAGNFRGAGLQDDRAAWGVGARQSSRS